MNKLIWLAIAFALSAYLAAGIFHMKFVTSTVEAQAEERATYRPTGLEGKLYGRVLFDGAPPIRKKIDMSQDRNCSEIAKNPRTEDFIVVDGGLANVFVYVKGGELGRFVFENPSDSVVLDQQHCQFTPRVLGLQIRQTLVILNSDHTTHNVHPSPLVNTEWNRMQAPYATPIEMRFRRPETMIPVKCNQHPWMKAYVGVLSHPFFAVGSRDGSYSIAGLPAGDYTLVAWHEIAGEKTVALSIGPGEAKQVDLVFSAKASGLLSHSLEIARSIHVN